MRKKEEDKAGIERRSFPRRRGCRFCTEPNHQIDYKDQTTLQHFVTERFKIVPRRISGNCAGHQREMEIAIKRARHMAFLPYGSTQM